MHKWLGPLVRYVLYAAFACCVLHQALASRAETLRLLNERRKIRAEINLLHCQNVRRDEICAALTSDPFYVERLLRERYGYRNPNEIVNTDQSRGTPF